MAERADPEIPERPADSPKAAVPAGAETRYMPEVSASMLDVHALHQTVRTWKDFFIHIATIVIGLLIAIGLEQTVEFFHHRHQVAEARDQLETELRINVAIFDTQILEMRRLAPILQRDLEVLHFLREHPGAPRSSWPGELSWWYVDYAYVLSAWNAAHESSVLALMPRREVEQRSALYSSLAALNESTKEATQRIWVSFSYGIRDEDPARMTPAELDASMEAVTATLILYARMFNLQWNLHNQFPQFSPGPDPSDWRKIVRVVSPERDRAEADVLRDNLREEIERIQAQDKHR
jgi:hypothetical protein